MLQQVVLSFNEFQNFKREKGHQGWTLERKGKWHAWEKTADGVPAQERKVKMSFEMEDEEFDPEDPELNDPTSRYYIQLVPSAIYIFI